ncbi:MAG: peptide ABC transporter substrate-binding protein [Chlamydiales bacterium]|nr:peptide ABC transporter substrate-binding protein [Chlamydiales bacterium]
MKKVGVGVLLLLTLTLFSCSQGKKKSPSSQSQTVHLSIISQVRSLDPRISNEYPTVHIINMLYEGLMRLGPTGEIEPGVAESYEISDDMRTYTFHLKDTVWSNGDPLTAYDFEYAWKKSVNPLSARTGSFTFYTIKNVEACLQRKVPVEEVGIKALDPQTLQVELEHPAPYFLSLCSCGTYSPIHKQIDQADPGWANDIGDHFVSNGPFKLAKWKKGVEIYLEKNPDYWEKDCVKVKGIHIQVLPDANTQHLLFEKGELDFIGYPINPLPVDIIANTLKNGELKTTDAFGLFWFFVNTEKPPFDNKNFRKAVAYALDRRTIAEHVFQLGEVPAMGILNGEIAVSKTPYFQDANIDEAKRYLALALQEMGKTLDQINPIVLSQRSCLFTSRVDQAVQQQLFQNLGLVVEIDQADWPVHFNRMSKGDYEFGEMGWNSWLRDPIYMLDTFRNRSLATNMSRWEHPTYQELLRKSDFEVDQEKRKEYLHQAEAFLMEEMPVIPLCFNKLHYLCNDRLKGVYISPMKEIDFRYATIQE